MLTHYQTLKVAEDAPPEVIKAAYRALSQQHHPDSNQESQEEALRAMQAINEAYEALIDPESRSAYDEQIRSMRVAAAGGSEAAPDLAGGTLVKRGGPDSAAIEVRPHRRRRSRSSRHHPDHALVPSSSEVYFHSSGRSRGGSLVRAESRLAPMFTSSQSTAIHGRMLPQSADDPQTPATPPGPGKRGFRMISIIITACVLAMLLLAGLVAWRLGWVNRFWVWFQREQALEASRGLVFGGRNDVVPMVDPNERPYDRPALTPQGRPWPEETGYLPGTEQRHTQGRCEVVVDNVLHDADVHVKLLALPADDEGDPIVVREAFIATRSQMRFENLPPGRYELRYRSLSSGLIFRAAALELSQDAARNSSSKTVSLYKVIPGNLQRPLIAEDAF
ncbi:MAG: J domain-containing protein [Prosthecobacter sp.]|jgi:hypothetical protein|uniref:J domain-containing protein n=1 Tax=Prosthecobacter sp. TaxID=1965333 RepID=UPI0019EF2FB9|nr:J domain-containing protein [Prosthecobacter sp.]MBE2282700.1 J domain-containing protein [Prosthecobacter sp.]